MLRFRQIHRDSSHEDAYSIIDYLKFSSIVFEQSHPQSGEKEFFILEQYDADSDTWNEISITRGR